MPAKERGAVLVEFAFVGPILFLIVIGLLDFSLIIVGNTVGTNAVREGARVGVINYIDADQDEWPTSANYERIVTEIERRLVGLVRDDIEISVRCVDGEEDDPHGMDDGVRGPDAGTIPCTADFVTPGADLLEVTLKWSHIGASPFVANANHNESAMFVIQGQAQYTPPSTTTTLISPSSSTTTTTTTTLPGDTSTTTDPGATTTTTTTTPQDCQISSYTTSRTTTALTIYKKGAKAGQVKSPGALTVSVYAPGCAAGTVTIRIPGGPAPYAAGVAMDFVSAGSFSYQIGGSDWSTGTYTVTLRSPANTKTFTLSVYG